MKHTKKILYILAIAVILLAANSIFGLNPFRKLSIEDVAASSVIMNAALASSGGGKKAIKIGDNEIELKLDFKAGEDPYFIIDMNGFPQIENKLSLNIETKTISKETGFAGSAAFASNSPIPGVAVKLIDPSGNEIENSNLKIQNIKSDSKEGLLEIRVSKGAASFKPGIWKMLVDIETKKNILRAQQDFSWGVLAINTNKAVYQVKSQKSKVKSNEENAYLQMAVLDDKGETVCDADLELKIMSPSNSVVILRSPEASKGGEGSLALEDKIGAKDNVVYRSGKCGRNNITDVPDYFAYYDVEEAGEYKMELTAHTANGRRTIFDTFEAKEYVPFEIERIAPTRIYPKAEYEIKIKIKADEDFDGNIIEALPQNFKFLSPRPIRLGRKILNLKKISNNQILNNKEVSDTGNQKTAYAAAYGLLADLPVSRLDKSNKSIANAKKLSSTNNYFFNRIKEFLNFEFGDKNVYAAEEAKYNIGYQKIVLAESISLKAGDEIELSYKFDAPDITPELFLAGPLELRAKKTDEAADNYLVYIEPRVWQIASDGLNTSYIRNDSARTYVQTQNTTGLIGMWDLDSASYNQTTDTIYGKYGSDLLTSVSDPALTTGFDGRANTAILFDGSADYLTQKVYANKIGTVTMATVATGALFNDAGRSTPELSFSQYAGASGNTPYMIVVTDTSGYKAWGYIGEEGTGETLDIEKISNGNMETGNPPTGWFEEATDPTPTRVSDERTGGSGFYSLNVARGSGDYSMRQSFTSITNNLYKISYWMKKVDATNVKIIVRDNDASEIYLTPIAATSSWVNYIGYFTAKSTTTKVYLIVVGSSGQSGRWDDISVKLVTALPANTGVKIYSTRNGSTQSWANIDTGFLPNSIASYEVKKSDFQIETGSVSFGALVKFNSLGTTLYLLDKGRSYTTNGKGFGIRKAITDQLVITISDRVNYINKFTANTVTTNVWYSIVGVYDSSTKTAILYVNGNVWCNETNLNIDNITGYRPLTVGCNSDLSQFHNGSIASPFVYNRVLTATEVSNMYNSQKKRFIE